MATPGGVDAGVGVPFRRRMTVHEPSGRAVSGGEEVQDLAGHRFRRVPGHPVLRAAAGPAGASPRRPRAAAAPWAGGKCRSRSRPQHQRGAGDVRRRAAAASAACPGSRRTSWPRTRAPRPAEAAPQVRAQVRRRAPRRGAGTCAPRGGTPAPAGAARRSGSAEPAQESGSPTTSPRRGITSEFMTTRRSHARRDSGPRTPARAGRPCRRRPASAALDLPGVEQRAAAARPCARAWPRPARPRCRPCPASRTR